MKIRAHSYRFVFCILAFYGLRRALHLRDVTFGALGDGRGGFAGVLSFEQAQVTHDGLKQKSTAHLILLQLRMRSVG